MMLARIHPDRGLSLLLLATIVASALWIRHVIEGGEDAASGTPGQAGRQDVREEVRLVPDFALLRPGQELAETTARPLFNPARRSKAQATADIATPPETMQKGRYALEGVSILPDKRYALLREIATNKTVHVGQSEQVNGLLVASVTPTSVILKKKGEHEELPLKVAPAPKLAEPPPHPGQPSVPGQPPGAKAQNGQSPPTPGQPTQVDAPSGPRQAAEDVANADPITEADLIEAEERRRAKRARRAIAGEGQTN